MDILAIMDSDIKFMRYTMDSTKFRDDLYIVQVWWTSQPFSTGDYTLDMTHAMSFNNTNALSSHVGVHFSSSYSSFSPPASSSFSSSSSSSSPAPSSYCTKSYCTGSHIVESLRGGLGSPIFVVKQKVAAFSM